jgi:hypothetical protein
MKAKHLFILLWGLAGLLLMSCEKEPEMEEVEKTEFNFVLIKEGYQWYNRVELVVRVVYPEQNYTHFINNFNWNAVNRLDSVICGPFENFEGRSEYQYIIYLADTRAYNPPWGSPSVPPVRYMSDTFYPEAGNHGDIIIRFPQDTLVLNRF